MEHQETVLDTLPSNSGISDTLSPDTIVPSTNVTTTSAMDIDHANVVSATLGTDSNPTVLPSTVTSSTAAVPKDNNDNNNSIPSSTVNTLMNPSSLPYMSPLHQVALLQQSSPMLTTDTTTLSSSSLTTSSTSPSTTTTTQLLPTTSSLNPLILMATNLLATNPLAALSPNVLLNNSLTNSNTGTALFNTGSALDTVPTTNSNNNNNNNPAVMNPFASVALPGTTEYFLQLQQQMAATAALMSALQGSPLPSSSSSSSSSGSTLSSSSSPSTNPAMLNPALFLNQLQSMLMSPASALLMNNNLMNNTGNSKESSSKKKKKHKKSKKESKDRHRSSSASRSHSKHRYESSSSSDTSDYSSSSSSSSGRDQRRSSSNSKHRSSSIHHPRSHTPVSSSVQRARSSSHQRLNFEGAVVSHYASLNVPSVREKNSYESKLDEMIERYGAEEGDRPPPQPEDGSDSDAADLPNDNTYKNNRYVSPNKSTDYTRRSVSSSLLRMVSPLSNPNNNGSGSIRSTSIQRSPSTTMHHRSSPSTSLVPSTTKASIHPPQEGEGSRLRPFILTPRSKSKPSTPSSSSSSSTTTTSQHSSNPNANDTNLASAQPSNMTNPSSSVFPSSATLPFPGLGLSLPLPPLPLPLPLPLPSLLPNMFSVFPTTHHNTLTTTAALTDEMKNRSPSHSKSPKEPRRSLSQHSSASSISLGETTATSMTGTSESIDSYSSGSGSSSSEEEDDDDNDSLPEDILEAVASGKGDDPEVRKAIKRYQRSQRTRHQQRRKNRNHASAYPNDKSNHERRSSSVTLDNRLPLKSALKSQSFGTRGGKHDPKGKNRSTTENEEDNYRSTPSNRERERSRSNVRFAVPDDPLRRDTYDKSNAYSNNKRSVSVDLRIHRGRSNDTEDDRSSRDSSLSSHSRSSSVPTHGRSQSVPADHRANQARTGLGGLGGLLGLSSFGLSKPVTEAKLEQGITKETSVSESQPSSSSSSGKEISAVPSNKPTIRRSSSVPMDIEGSRKSTSPSTVTVTATTFRTNNVPSSFDSFIRSGSSPKVLKKNDSRTDASLLSSPSAKPLNDTPSTSSAGKARISKSVPRELSSSSSKLNSLSSPHHASPSHTTTTTTASPQTLSPFRHMPKSALLGLMGTAPTQLDAKTTRSGRISHKPLEHWKGIHLSSNYEGDTRINVVGVQARTLGSLGSLGALSGGNTAEVINLTAEPEPVVEKKSSSATITTTAPNSKDIIAKESTKKEKKEETKPKREETEAAKPSKKRKRDEIVSPDKEETKNKDGKKVKLSGKGEHEGSKLNHRAKPSVSSSKETAKVSTPGSAKGKKSTSSNASTTTPVTSTTATTKSSEKKKAKKKEKKSDGKSKSPKIQTPSSATKSPTTTTFTSTSTKSTNDKDKEKDKTKDKKNKGSTKPFRKEGMETTEKSAANKSEHPNTTNDVLSSTTINLPAKLKKRKLGESRESDTNTKFSNPTAASSSSSTTIASTTASVPTKEVWNITLPEDVVPTKGKKKGTKTDTTNSTGTATITATDTAVLDYSNYTPPSNQSSEEWDPPQIAALIYSFGAIPFRTHPSFWTDVAKLVPGKNPTECKEKWTLLGEEGEDGVGIKPVKESRKGNRRTKPKTDTTDGMETDTTEGTIGSIDDESRLAKALMNTDNAVQEPDLATLLTAGPGTEAAVSQALGTKGSKRRKDAEKEILLAMAKGQLPIILGHQGEIKNQHNGDIFAAQKKNKRTEALPRSSPVVPNPSPPPATRSTPKTKDKNDNNYATDPEASASIAKSRPRRSPETSLSSSPAIVAMVNHTTPRLPENAQPSPSENSSSTITKTRSSSRRPSSSTNITTTPGFGMSGIRAILGENDTSMSSTPGKGMDALLISPEPSPTGSEPVPSSVTKSSRTTSRFTRTNNSYTTTIPDHDAAYKPLPGQQKLGNAFAEHLKNKSQGGFFEGNANGKGGKPNSSSSSSSYDIFAMGGNTNGKKIIGPRKKHMGGKVTVDAIISGPNENETGIASTMLHPASDHTYQRINGRLVLGQQYTLTAEVSPSGTTRFVRKRVDGQDGDSEDEIEGIGNMEDMLSEEEENENDV